MKTVTTIIAHPDTSGQFILENLGVCRIMILPNPTSIEQDNS